MPRELIQSIYAYKRLISTVLSQFQIFENEPFDLNPNCYAKLKIFSDSNDVVLLPVATF